MVCPCHDLPHSEAGNVLHQQAIRVNCILLVRLLLVGWVLLLVLLQCSLPSPSLFVFVFVSVLDHTSMSVASASSLYYTTGLYLTYNLLRTTTCCFVILLCRSLFRSYVFVVVCFVFVACCILRIRLLLCHRRSVFHS